MSKEITNETSLKVFFWMVDAMGFRNWGNRGSPSRRWRHLWFTEVKIRRRKGECVLESCFELRRPWLRKDTSHVRSTLVGTCLYSIDGLGQDSKNTFWLKLNGYKALSHALFLLSHSPYSISILLPELFSFVQSGTEGWFTLSPSSGSTYIQPTFLKKESNNAFMGVSNVP